MTVHEVLRTSTAVWPIGSDENPRGTGKGGAARSHTSRIWGGSILTNRRPKLKAAGTPTRGHSRAGNLQSGLRKVERLRTPGKPERPDFFVVAVEGLGTRALTHMKNGLASTMLRCPAGQTLGSRGGSIYWLYPASQLGRCPWDASQEQREAQSFTPTWYNLQQSRQRLQYLSPCSISISVR
jgi:hypothetical protein